MPEIFDILSKKTSNFIKKNKIKGKLVFHNKKVIKMR